VRSSRAANTSAARREDARTIARTTGRRPAPRLRGLRAGDPHHDCADYGPETRTTPHTPPCGGFFLGVKLATLIMSKEIRQVLSGNCCRRYGNRVENGLNSGRFTGKSDFFDGVSDRSMPP